MFVGDYWVDEAWAKYLILVACYVVCYGVLFVLVQPSSVWEAFGIIYVSKVFLGAVLEVFGQS